jgi:hypothetical protein
VFMVRLGSYHACLAVEETASGELQLPLRFRARVKCREGDWWIGFLLS